MLADYEFYKNEYKGIVVADANSYDFFGERASDELALFSQRKVFDDDETAQNQLKRCACRIADILYASTNGKGVKKNIASEGVAGYYNVSYAQVDDKQVQAQINSAINLYIGRYLFGTKRVMW
jgi:hypothetical protein